MLVILWVKKVVLLVNFCFLCMFKGLFYMIVGVFFMILENNFMFVGFILVILCLGLMFWMGEILMCLGLRILLVVIVLMGK